MKGICPQCEDVRELKRVAGEEQIPVRGESIPVQVEYTLCTDCGEEFHTLSDECDPLDVAYREYRRRHGMMQPEEIREIRKRYGLTQRELSELVGWGGATLSRYENGALQDEAHDKLLQFIREPRNLWMLVEQRPEAVSEAAQQRIEREMRSMALDALPMGILFEERFGGYEPDIYSGFRRLEIDKLYQAILFFCAGGVVKTKLNKLLFYADFKHFKTNALSITGARYARLPYGPVPDHYEYYYAALIQDRGDLAVREVAYSSNWVCEELVAVKSSDFRFFSDTEMMVLNAVKKKFESFSAQKISDFSHREKGYVETPDSRFISYEYARNLQF